MRACTWLLLALAIVLLGGRREAAARHRRRRGIGYHRVASRPLPLLCGLLTIALGAVFASAIGLAIALPVSVLVAAMARRWVRPRQDVLDRRSVAFVLDLLACVLAVGAPPELAIAAVAAAVEEHGSNGLRRAVRPLQLTGRLVRLGTEPAQAWGVLDAVPELAAVAAAGRRCADSGARLAATLSVTATNLRAEQRVAALARAERVGVRALLPLGCCFLPAFVCIGVLPVVIGIGGTALNVG